MPRSKKTRRSSTIFYISDGFEEDCLQLIDKFYLKSSFSLDDFKVLWDQLKFGDIYWGRHKEDEIDLFTNECFKIILRMFLRHSDQNFRTGAFFLLYCMYCVQPQSISGKQRTKTRIRLDEIHLQNIYELFQFSVKNEHFDMPTTFFILRNTYDAIRFVAVLRPMGPLSSKYLDGPPEKNYQVTMAANAAVGLDALKKLRIMYHKYKEIRCNVSGIPEGFGEDYLDSTETLLKDLLPEGAATASNDPDPAPSPASAPGPAPEKQSIGDRRAKLKQLQFEKSVPTRLGMNGPPPIPSYFVSNPEETTFSDELSSDDKEFPSDDEDAAYLERLLMKCAPTKPDQGKKNKTQEIDINAPSCSYTVPSGKAVDSDEDSSFVDGPSDLIELLKSVGVDEKEKVPFGIKKASKKKSKKRSLEKKKKSKKSKK